MDEPRRQELTDRWSRMSSREKWARRLVGGGLVLGFCVALVVGIVRWAPLGRAGNWAFAVFMVVGSVWAGWVGYRRGRQRS